jgi:hypothetical protein
MKKITTLLLATGMFVSLSGIMFTGCTKKGDTGAAGKDQNATCTQCHTFSDTIVAKMFQYAASKHATGSTLTEATRNACAPCHSSQGFEECLKSGADTTLYGYDDAAPINCRTCHQIHDTYTASDWAVRTTASYTLRMDHTITVDLQGGNGVLKGTANLCGRCHQARPASPWVTNPDGTDSLTITSSRWGPHHGPQSIILAGKGAFSIGGANYGNSPHRDKAACMTCHGGYAQGNVVGGHTLWMSDPTPGGLGNNVTVCKGSDCHTNNPTSFDIDGKQTEISGMLQQLKVALATASIIDTVGDVLNFKGHKTRKFTERQLAVVWNYFLIDADRSKGVHNYQYTHDLLAASIAGISAKGR